ncbi:MAG: pyruvate kinase [Bacteroidia bacterium]|nr:pyruvate kinase [Bacteroidia bacterium]
MSKRAKIVATIGPASSSEAVLEEMMFAGLDVCRINFSHSSYEQHQSVIETVRELNRKHSLFVPILADLQGPKLRIGEVENGSCDIQTGNTLLFTTEKCLGNSEKVYMTYQQFPMDVKQGETILVDDGKLVFKVLETNGKDLVKAEIVHGGKLSSKKGVNLPNTKVSLPSLTEKDLKDLDFALENDVEWIGLSFVRSASDIIELRHRIDASGKKAKIIAKIEKPEALEELDSIIEQTDAVMVARGDLGVEIPMQKVPGIQKMIVRKCLASAKPVIIATQMMESMITNVSPTRAEVNDVANSILDGADALMLSGETSVGEHPAKVVEAMNKIILHVEETESVFERDNPPSKDSDRFLSESICYTATTLARQSEAKAIITMTHSGFTAFKVSANRPKAGIYVFTDNRPILNTLNLVWGVKGFYYDKYVSTDHTIADLKHKLKKDGFLQTGDRVVNVASIPISERGGANMLKLSLV